MKTKIVYVVASLDADIYMEQAIVSAWSACHYNPDSRIEMVCDQDTYATLDSGIRAQYKSLFDQIHVREFQPEQSMMERSRWLKTTLREIIEGDYLYIDTDTVVCADLSDVDDYEFDLGMALDHNCEYKVYLYRDGVIKRTKRLYDVDISNEPSYFNAGVSYVKDTVPAHEFFRSWHELWTSKRYENEGLKDQSALAATNVKHNHLITEISGDLNCQVMASIQYLHTAKIMHYYNTIFTTSVELNPFYGKKLFEYVKNNGITDDVQYKILNNKSLFTSPSMPVPYEGAMLWRKYHSSSEMLKMRIDTTNSYYLLLLLWYYMPKFMFIIDKVIGLPIYILRGIRNLCKSSLSVGKR